jgi:hypothetical protein
MDSQAMANASMARREVRVNMANTYDPLCVQSWQQNPQMYDQQQANIQLPRLPSLPEEQMRQQPGRNEFGMHWGTDLQRQIPLDTMYDYGFNINPSPYSDESEASDQPGVEPPRRQNGM